MRGKHTRRHGSLSHLIANNSYLKYAEVCAQAVRNVLKEEFVAAAQKRAGNEGRFSKWEAGKQLESSKSTILIILLNVIITTTYRTIKAR